MLQVFFWGRYFFFQVRYHISPIPIKKENIAYYGAESPEYMPTWDLLIIVFSIILTTATVLQILLCTRNCYIVAYIVSLNPYCNPAKETKFSFQDKKVETERVK